MFTLFTTGRQLFTAWEKPEPWFDAGMMVWLMCYFSPGMTAPYRPQYNPPPNGNPDYQPPPGALSAAAMVAAAATATATATATAATMLVHQDQQQPQYHRHPTPTVVQHPTQVIYYYNHYHNGDLVPYSL